LNPLLDLAIAAHGGLDRWEAFNEVTALLTIDGELGILKQNPGTLGPFTVTASTSEACATLAPFGCSGRRATFVPDRVTIEGLQQEVIEALEDPRAAFAGHDFETAWDDLHVAYFHGYLLWTHLVTPFLYAFPNFATEELPPWREGNEEWRRLKIVFPEHMASHSREQVSYFDAGGLLRRHDYQVDILGGRSCVDYMSDYREYHGIQVPRRRRMFEIAPGARPTSQCLLLSIDITEMSFR